MSYEGGKNKETTDMTTQSVEPDPLLREKQLQLLALEVAHDMLQQDGSGGGGLPWGADGEVAKLKRMRLQQKIQRAKAELHGVVHEPAAVSIIAIYNTWQASGTSEPSDWYVSQGQVNDFGTMRPAYKLRFRWEGFGNPCFENEDYRPRIACHDKYIFTSTEDLEQYLNMIGF